MTRTLAAHAAALDVTLAGSVIAVPPARRLDHARSLTATGHWVHADRIEGSFRGQAGVSLEEVHELARIPDIRLDVHLMVDDLMAELSGTPQPRHRSDDRAERRPGRPCRPGATQPEPRSRGLARRPP